MLMNYAYSYFPKLYLFFFFSFCSVISICQVGVGTDKPDSSAVLEVSSFNKGFLPPRMRAFQRDGITKPAAGLLIYCVNCGASGSGRDIMVTVGQT